MTRTTEAQKRAMKKYRESDKGKAIKREWLKTDIAKAAFARSQAKYQKTEKGKAKSKESMAKYWTTDKGMATRARAKEKRRKLLKSE